MGEIIIKVPDDVREIIQLNLPASLIKSKFAELEEEENTKKALQLLNKYKHKIEFEDVSDEEIHLQGD